MGIKMSVTVDKARAKWDKLGRDLVAIGFTKTSAGFSEQFEHGDVVVSAGACGPAVSVRGEYIGGIDNITGLVPVLVGNVV